MRKFDSAEPLLATMTQVENWFEAATATAERRAKEHRHKSKLDAVKRGT